LFSNIQGATFEWLIQKIHRRQAGVGVIGLGYVGIPPAVEFARAGFSVTSFDTDTGRVEQASCGSSYISDVSDKVPLPQVKSGKLRATTNFRELSHVDNVSICAPTPLSETKYPVLSLVIQAVDAMADQLHWGRLVIFEGTTYHSTIEEIALPRLE
jgi:UDP-N-acetyl-D-glucosamine dehydrogenase